MRARPDVVASQAGVSACSTLYFVPGKLSRKRGPIPSRGYLSFSSAETAASFTDLFRETPPSFGGGAVPGPGGGGGTDVPVARLALCQKTFRSKHRRDSRQDTIERDADYKAFLETLQAPPEKPSSDPQFDQSKDDGQKGAPKVAALVEYLRDRKTRKERGEQRSKRTTRPTEKTLLQKEPVKVRCKTDKKVREVLSKESSASAGGVRRSSKETSTPTSQAAKPAKEHSSRPSSKGKEPTTSATSKRRTDAPTRKADG